MGKKMTNRQILSFKLDHLTDSELDEVMEYVSIMETMKGPSRREQKYHDHLIDDLSTTYENRRAQKVVEWEGIRHRSHRVMHR
jgi:hypothetical protein